MGQLKGEALCEAWLDIIRLLYGNEMADASRATYSKGWYVVEKARRYHDGSIGRLGIPRSMRRREVAEMVNNLKATVPWVSNAYGPPTDQ